MASVKKQLSELARKGPHKVLRGDLAVAGTPGMLYAPASGSGFAGLALGHDWLSGAAAYEKTLAHLASWGVVAVAPDSERGPLPSDLRLATDLGSAMEVLAGIPLGGRRGVVDPTKIGVAGHGFGAGAAVLAASRAGSRAAGLAALYPAPTGERTLVAATDVDIPSFILAAAGDLDTMTSNALALRTALGDRAALRTVPKAVPRGLGERRLVRKQLGLGGSDKHTQRLTRALLTGWALGALARDNAYRAFTDPTADLGPASVVDIDALEPDEIDHLTKLLKS